MVDKKDEDAIRFQEPFRRAAEKLALEQQAQMKENLIKRKAEAREVDRGARSREADEKWEKFMKSTTDAVEKGQVGNYQTWAISMAEVFMMCSLMLDALVASDPYTTLLDIPLYKGLSLYKAGTHIMDQALTSAEMPEIKLPKLHYLVQMTEDNKLKTTPLLRNDGQPVTPEQQGVFDEGVNTWLEIHGYTKEPSGEFTNEAGDRLTKETFDRLRDSPDDHVGLHAYLTGKFQMEFVERSTPSP